VRRGERLVDFDVGGRDESLRHGVQRCDVRPPHPRPPVALVLFNDPQVFVFFHPYASLTRYFEGVQSPAAANNGKRLGVVRLFFVVCRVVRLPPVQLGFVVARR